MADKVLVIGSGAREHVIATTLLSGPGVDRVWCAPGNPGMEPDGISLLQEDSSQPEKLIAAIRELGIDWVFVGPEAPLTAGLVDELQAAGIPAFGPTKAAARIEGSKGFAKDLMRRHGIPTADYAVFHDLDSAKSYVHSHGAPVVIKADGLAAGKGVTVAADLDQAIQALDDIFIDHKFGQAGAQVVIEDQLVGQECSLMCFVRGEQFWPMPLSQDHKPAYDGDRGPNTGGMGAYSPLPQFGPELTQKALDTIVAPTVRALAQEGSPFTGVLYTGLMVTDKGPQVVEFNARLGDPETEVVLPALTSDLGTAIRTLMEGGEPQFTWDESHSRLGVVLAAQGYPGNPKTGVPVPLIAPEQDLRAYYAGVSGSASTGLTSSSGRTALVVAQGDDLDQAARRVYDRLDGLSMPGLFYRHDIGHRGLEA
ncbi:phosphoribosylamine--glycine ligase [Bifidobacterium asteroides]|uniref:phosphoribosylamine--glycine ligase n=1 Tax=Bifidobacterium asteroides TaxID=1684 RepID=UPI002741FB92|nr:phosphoribosylamine--glycine ligase [Bifidobacterium asteroides]WLT10189.1 phosphoribosylamine--glycine ligase [Bifidobacterium asteroides]